PRLPGVPPRLPRQLRALAPDRRQAQGRRRPAAPLRPPAPLLRHRRRETLRRPREGDLRRPDGERQAGDRVARVGVPGMAREAAVTTPDLSIRRRRAPVHAFTASRFTSYPTRGS